MKTIRNVFVVFCALSVLLYAAAAFALTVETDELADGAVTTPKIADSAVTANKVADGAVTETKITAGAVTTGKIADNAETDAKIAGPISASKISSAGLNADTVDGVHAAELAPAVHSHAQSEVAGLESSLAGKADSAHHHDGSYQKKYANVLVVAKSGGDFTDPVAALNSITDASAANPYLVKVMPGVYEIASTASTRPYVDLEGSGENVTRIVQTGPSSVISGTANSEIRALTVELVNGGQLPYPVMMWNSSSPTLRNVTFLSSVATFAIQSDWGAPVLIDVTINLNGGSACMQSNSAGPVWINVNCTVTGNAYGYGLGYCGNPGTPRIIVKNSRIEASRYSLWEQSADMSIFVLSSQLVGPVGAGSGSIKCMNVYDGNYDPIACP